MTLLPFIKKLTTDVVLTTIEFGDMAWVGEGPDCTTVNVGVEYKKLGDVLTCMVDGRFVGHQLPGLLLNYDRVYLLVETGQMRADRNSGVLQQRRGDRWYDIARNGRGFMYRDLAHWETTIEEQTQVRVIHTFDEYESARWLASKHSWWVNKGWDEHDALKQFHVPPPPTVSIEKPGVLRRVVKELYKIGWEKSEAVCAKFSSIREMANANEQTWREIPGIGPTIAKRIIQEITGNNK